MKRVLIISFHSLPLDVIASYRANAYLKHFKKFGIMPDLLTHFKGCQEKKEVQIEREEYGTIHRIPLKKNYFTKWVSFFESVRFVNRASILLRWSLGFLDSSTIDLMSFFSLKEYCKKTLNIYDYDLVIGIFSPHHHLKLCHWLYKKYKIPYVLDFRDLWSNRIMNEYYSPSFVEKIQDLFCVMYWKKWLSNALFFTITSNSWKNKINKFSLANGSVISNGFDAEVFKDIVNNLAPSKFFEIVYAGSLYENQKLEIFLEGCKIFIDNNLPDRFRVRFIGSDRGGALKGKDFGYMYNPKKRIHKILNERYCDVTERISKVEVLKSCASAQILLFLSHPTISGWHSGKIFDYLGAGRPILIVPDDLDVVAELITNTNAGVIKNTAQEVAEYLESVYNDWLMIGKIKYEGDLRLINQYSRESQVEKLAQLISEKI